MRFPQSHQDGSLKPLTVLKIDAECAIFIAQRDDRPLPAQVQLHAHNLLLSPGEVSNVSQRDFSGYLLLERKSRLWNRGDVRELRVNLDVADTEKTLKRAIVGSDCLTQESVGSRGKEAFICQILRAGKAACCRRVPSHC